jgi:hypothetical protein
MSKKPDNGSAEITDNERAAIELGRGGKWIDFDKAAQPVQTETAPTLAFLDAPAGVNFVKEFVRQYAEQQGYSDERAMLLQNKAHNAIQCYEDGREGVKLRLVSHIDGLAIDDPKKRHREAFWMLTNAKEFNSFLDAVDEPERWHDQLMFGPESADRLNTEPEPETLDIEAPSTNRRSNTLKRASRPHPLSKVIDLAIRNAGGLQSSTSFIWNEFCRLAEASEPTPPLTGVIDRPSEGQVKETTIRYWDFDQEEQSIKKSAFARQIERRKKMWARTSE